MAQLLGILSSPIVTRLYSPSDYGAFAVVASLLSVLIPVACIRYELAIPLPGSDVVAADVVVLCLVVTATVSLITVPILWLAGPWILQSIGASALRPYVFLLPVAVLGGGVVAALTGWMIRTKSYSEIAANRLTQSGTVVAAQVGLGLLGAGAAGLLVGVVAGSYAGLSRLARAAWRGSTASFRAVTRAGVLSAATRYRRFPILSAPSAFLNNFGLEAPVLLIVALFGAGTGGRFALAQRVVALPVGLLAAAVAQVFFAEAARLARDRPTELRTLFWRTSRTLALTAIVPFVVGGLASPLLFGFFFGEDWGEAGIYVAILAPMYFLQFVATPTGGTLDVLERQDLNLIREIGRIFIVGGAILAAAALHLSPIGAVAAVSTSGCITYALYGLFSWRAIVAHHPGGVAARMVPFDPMDDPPRGPDV